MDHIDSGLTNGQIKRMAKFEVNGQILDFFDPRPFTNCENQGSANGHGHSPKVKNPGRRMAMAILHIWKLGQ